MIPRAVILPLASASELASLDAMLDARAAAVSLAGDAPTHLVLVADELPAALVASVLRARDGHVLWGEPDGAAFAEGAAEAAPVRGLLALYLSGLPEPLTLPSDALRSVRNVLAPAWQDPVSAHAPVALAARDVTLVPSAEPRPTAAVIAEPARLDAIVFELAPQDVRFAPSVAEAVLIGAVAGLPGDAFHAIELGMGSRLYLPLGRQLSAAVGHLLGVDGERSFFWRGDRIVAVAHAAFRPLTLRDWRAWRRQ